jgi:hypothetical protein
MAVGQPVFLSDSFSRDYEPTRRTFRHRCIANADFSGVDENRPGFSHDVFFAPQREHLRSSPGCSGDIPCDSSLFLLSNVFRLAATVPFAGRDLAFLGQCYQLGHFLDLLLSSDSQRTGGSLVFRVCGWDVRLRVDFCPGPADLPGQYRLCGKPPEYRSSVISV